MLSPTEADGTGLEFARDVRQGLEIPQGGETQVRIRARRPDAPKGTVQLRGSSSDGGLTIAPVTLEPDQDEGTLTIQANPKMRADSRHTVVLSGVIRFGTNQSSTRTLPAIRVHVVAGKTEPTSEKK